MSFVCLGEGEGEELWVHDFADVEIGGYEDQWLSMWYSGLDKASVSDGKSVKIVFAIAVFKSHVL